MGAFYRMNKDNNVKDSKKMYIFISLLFTVAQVTVMSRPHVTGQAYQYKSTENDLHVG